jgi:hypothetical protein
MTNSKGKPMNPGEQQYLDLLRDVRDNGSERIDRTKV